MGENPEVWEWQRFSVDEDTGIEQIGVGSPGSNSQQTFLKRTVDLNGDLEVFLAAGGTAQPELDYELLAYYHDGTDWQVADVTASQGQYSVIMPSGIQTVNLVPNPIAEDEEDVEGNETVDLQIVANGSSYTILSERSLNQITLREPALFNQVTDCSCICTCPAANLISESEASRSVVAKHNLVGGVQLVLGEPASVFTGSVLLPPWPSETPARVELHLSINGTWDTRPVSIPFEEYEAFSHAAATFVRPAPVSGTGLYAFDVGYYDDSIVATFYDAEDELMTGFSNVVGTARGDFLYVDWTFWWFGTGWGIAGLSSLYVDGDHAVLRDGDGLQHQFRKRGIEGSEEWVADAGPFDDYVLSSNQEETIYDVTDKHGAVQHFAQNGTTKWFRLLHRQDAAGNKTSYAYDNDDPNQWFGDYRPKVITDHLGRKTTLNYTNGVFTSVSYETGASALVTDVTSTSGELRTITDPLPGQGGQRPATNFTYEGGGPAAVRLKTMTDAEGAVTTWEYDDTTGDLESVERPDDSVRTFNYDDATNGLLAPWTGLPSVRTRDELDHEDRTVFDRFGRPLAVVDADGNLSWNVRDLSGFVVAAYGNDPDDLGPVPRPVTTFAYDDQHNLVALTAPDGGQRSWVYDDLSRVVDEFDELGRHTYFHIDSNNGNVLYKQEIVGAKNVVSYDEETGLASNVGDDRVTSFLYSSSPTYTETESGSGIWVTDDLPGGTVLQEQDPLGRTTAYEYWLKTDEDGHIANHGKISEVILPTVAGESAGSVVRTYSYDVNGNLDLFTDELGRETDYNYDALGRLTSTVFEDPYPGEGSSTMPDEVWTYDRLGRVTSYEDKNNNITGYVYTYDTANHRFRVTTTAPSRDATGPNVVSYVEYDSLGNLVTSVDPLGRTTTHAFDPLNRLRQTTAPDPDGPSGPLASPLTTFSYDRMGRQVARIDPADLRGMDPTLWTNMPPEIESGAVTSIQATTAVPHTEIDLFGIFKDEQDSDTALQYSIVAVTASGGGSSSGLFDKVWITSDTPRRLVLEYTGEEDFANAAVTVSATDTSGLAEEVTLTVTRSLSNDSEFRLNETTTNAQKRPAVAARGGSDAGFIAVWENAASTSIYARLFDEDTTPADSEFQVNTTSNVFEPSVASAPDGSFVVAYWHKHHDDQGKLLFQRYDSTGTAQGSEVTVYDSDPLSMELENPWKSSIAYLNDGNFVITYHGPNSTDSRNVMARRYAANGTAIGSEFQVNTTSTSSQLQPNVTSTQDGGFLIVWDGNGSGDSAGVFARKYDSAGNAIGSESLVNATTSGTQAFAVTASGGHVVAWQGNGPGDSLGVYARMRAADGTPASGEIPVNEDQTAATQGRPSVATLPDGGFAVAYHGNGWYVEGVLQGYEIFARRFLSNGDRLSLGDPEPINTYSIPDVSNGDQIDPAVAVTQTGAVIVAWSGKGSGDSSGVFARYLPVEPRPATPGPFRVLSVSPAETVTGPVEAILVTFSAPLNGSPADGEFTIVGPAGTVSTDDYNVALVSAAQALVTFTTPLTKRGQYSVTADDAIDKVGGGELDQDLDGTAGEATADDAHFAFYINGGESAPVEKASNPIQNISLQSDTTTAESIVDLAQHFEDLEQGATELLYTVMSISDDANKLFLSAVVSEMDGHKLVLRYNPGQTALQSQGTKVTITVRATDRTGRYGEAQFDIERGSALAGDPPDVDAFRVTSVGPYQVLAGPVDRFTVTFNDTVDSASLAAGDFVVTNPQGGNVTVSNATLIAANQVLVTLGGYTTLLGNYTINVKPTIARTAGDQLDQDEDGTPGETDDDPLILDDHFITRLYFAPGPRSRSEYDPTGRPVQSIDPLGNVTTSIYDRAGQLRGVTDPLGRTTVHRYDELGQLISVAQPYPDSGFDELKDDPDAVDSPDGFSVWQQGSGGYGNGQHRFAEPTVGGSDKFTYNFNVTAGKTYEVVISWPVVSGAATDTPYTVWDNATSFPTIDVNQQRPPEGHPIFGSGWQTLGYYTMTETTLRVRVTRNADGNVIADAVHVIEVTTPPETYSYDVVGNLEFITDSRGSQTKNVYDARYRRIEEWLPDPSTGSPSSSFKTIFSYDTAGQLKKVTDPLGRETGYDYDLWGRRKLLQEANPSTGLISSGALVTDYRYDDVGNLVSVEQPDLGGSYGRPKTQYVYDEHYNLVELWQPDPDGTDSAYSSPKTYFKYDDADRRRMEIDPRGNLRWNTYDDLDRLTKFELTPADAAFDDPNGTTTGWTRVTTGSPGYDGDHSTSTTTDVLTIDVTGLTAGKTYQVLATWQGDTPEDETDNTTDAQYKFKDGTATEFTVEVNQQLFPTDYFDGTRGWRKLGTFTADNTTGSMEIKRVATDGEAQADAIRIVEVGPVTQYEFDPRSNLLRTTDPLGRVTQYQRDVLDRQTSMIDALGFRDYLGFDAAGQLVTQVDNLGRATALTYDKLGRMTGLTQPDPDAAGPLSAPAYAYLFDAVGNRTRMTEPQVADVGGAAVSPVTDFTFDRLNRLTKIERHDPDGGSGDPRPKTEYGYTYASELETIKEWLNTNDYRITKREYDKLGRQSKVIEPNASDGAATGPETLYGYDALSRRVSETRPDPDGTGSGLPSPVTNWTLDNLGRVLKLEQPDPDGGGSLGRPTTEYAYDLASNVTLVKTPDPSNTSHAGTAAIETVFAYDYLNRRTSETRNDPDGGGALTAQATAYAYDLAGNLVKVTEPDPDGSGSLQSPVTWHTFDALNREVATLDPREGMTRQTFDGAGNRTSLTDPVLNTTAWTYDRLNRVTVDMNTLGDHRRYEYDAAGMLTRKIDRNGRVTKYAYDPLHRRGKEEWFANEADTGADRTFTWDYDIADQLESATDPAATLSYAYDRQGNVALVTTDLAGLGSAQTVYLRQTFDNLHRRKDSKASTGASENTLRDYVNTYAFDNVSRLTSITQDKQGSGSGYDDQIAPKRVDLVYNALGQTQKITRYKDTTATTEVAHTDQTFDKFGHLTTINHKKPTGPSDVLTRYTYGFDNLNRATSVDLYTEISGNNYDVEDVTAYAYDATDQLTVADRTTGTDESYVHDLNGNRRMAGTTNWVVGANNQLTGDGTYTYQYDDEGNRTKRTKTSDSSYVDYVYDHRNRLTQAVSKSSGGTITKQVDYVYDAFDRLVKRTLDNDGSGGGAAVDEYFVFDGNDVVLQFDGAGAVAHRYLNGQAADQVLADEVMSNGLTTSNRVYWPLVDMLGSVRDFVNNIAVLKNHITYNAFGLVTAETAGNINFLTGYAGYFRDEATGLNLTQTRWYDPLTAKWTSEDWIGFAGGDANLSRYVGNSPTNAVDPTGREAEDPLLRHLHEVRRMRDEAHRILNEFGKDVEDLISGRGAFAGMPFRDISAEDQAACMDYIKAHLKELQSRYDYLNSWHKEEDRQWNRIDALPESDRQARSWYIQRLGIVGQLAPGGMFDLAMEVTGTFVGFGGVGPQKPFIEPPPPRGAVPTEPPPRGVPGGPVTRPPGAEPRASEPIRPEPPGNAGKPPSGQSAGRPNSGTTEPPGKGIVVEPGAPVNGEPGNYYSRFSPEGALLQEAGVPRRNQGEVFISWTEHLGRNILFLREIQRCEGHNLSRVYGKPSDSFHESLLAGTFQKEKYAALLGRALGGTWDVSISYNKDTEKFSFDATRRSDKNE